MDNFGFYVWRTIDKHVVCDIFVDADVPKTSDEARAAAEAYVAAHKGDAEPPEGFTVAAVHTFPGES